MKKLLLTGLMLSCLSAFAQKTGAWSETVPFNSPSDKGQTRTIAFYVPTNYTPSTKCKLLVMLHGQGDDPLNFVTAMSVISTEAFPTLHYILVGPSEGTSGSGFIDPVGEDEGICDLAVSEAQRLYNIDPEYKPILCGFSFGGRAALHIGLEDYQKYRGLVLWTPAVASLNEADNAGGATSIDPYTTAVDSATFAYPNGKILPSCMTVGDEDPFGFTPIVEEVDNQMKLAHAHCYFSILGPYSTYWMNTGSEHSPPIYVSDYVNCFDFISTNQATALEELTESALNMMVYPNPAKNVATVSLNIPNEEYDKMTTIVFDALGRPVRSITNGYYNGDLRLNVDDLSSGIYFVKVITNANSYQQKLIIER